MDGRAVQQALVASYEVERARVAEKLISKRPADVYRHCNVKCLAYELSAVVTLCRFDADIECMLLDISKMFSEVAQSYSR